MSLLRAGSIEKALLQVLNEITVTAPSSSLCHKPAASSRARRLARWAQALATGDPEGHEGSVLTGKAAVEPLAAGGHPPSTVGHSAGGPGRDLMLVLL